MRILLTGICGFAGTHLARGLIESCDGLELVGIDNLSRRGSETNLEPLRQLGVDVRIGDIVDRTAIAALPAVDFVIDCAANPSVLAGVGSGTSSLSLVEQNLYGTVNLLEFCKRHGAGFLLLSTSRVYGIDALQTLPLSEGDSRFEITAGCRGAGWSARGIDESFSTTPPLSLYGSTKSCSELLALEYGAAFGFPVWINRCGVLAGAGQFGRADQGIFSFWIHAWRSAQPLKYIGFGGRGSQVRDCLHPRDLIPVLLRQIGHSSRGGPRIFNFSGGAQNSMSLRELSAWCAARFPGHPSPLIAMPEVETRPFDIPWLILDASLAGNAWDWQPQRPLGAVLEEIARHAEQHPDWLRACQ